MRLGELIVALEAADPDLVVPVGFADAHSYRGFYSELAVQPSADVRVGDMLATLRSALGQTFTAYKGGDYRMDEYSEVYLSYYGRASGEQIGAVLISYMLGRPTVPPKD